MIDFVTDPLGQEFIRRALLEVGLISLAGGALGCWVIFYGVSYAAESLSHALFPGLVLAALAGVPILVGGIPGIAVAAPGDCARRPGAGDRARYGRRRRGHGVLRARRAARALAESPPGIQSLLFGDILAPSDSDLLISAILAAAVILSLIAIHWRLLAVAFDRTTARSLGTSPAVADIAVLILLAAAVLVAAQGLGTLLAVAALVGPAATARVFTHRLGSMMLAATLLGIGAGVVGLYLSYYAGVAAGAAIAGCIVAAYLVAIAASLSLSLRAGWRFRRRRPDDGHRGQLERAGTRGALGGRLPKRRRQAAGGRAAGAPGLRADRARDRPGAPDVGRATVYRALEQLEGLGLIQRVDLGGDAAGYERVDPGGHHHHHIVCEQCGRVIAFEDDGLERAIVALAKRPDFNVSSHEVTLRGECAGCGRRQA